MKRLTAIAGALFLPLALVEEDRHHSLHLMLSSLKCLILIQFNPLQLLVLQYNLSQGDGIKLLFQHYQHQHNRLDYRLFYHYHLKIWVGTLKVSHQRI